MKDDVLKETAVSFHAAERSEFAPLIDELFREEILEARRMPPEQKFILGERLFNWACQITLAGIRNENPGISQDEARKMLRGRLELADRMGTL